MRRLCSRGCAATAAIIISFRYLLHSEEGSSAQARAISSDAKCEGAADQGGRRYQRQYHQADDTETTAGASPFAQFQAQRSHYYKHSLHGKGRSAASHEGGTEASAPPGSGGESSSSFSYSSEGKHKKEEKEQGRDGGGGGADEPERNSGPRVYGKGSASAQERRSIRSRWENAFLTRVHFDPGMHDRFATATEADEETSNRRKGSGKQGKSPTNKELFSSWPEDEEAPEREFLALPPPLQREYLINRLAMGERRVHYAPDYGSLTMMYQLNLGEMMVKECEGLLRKLEWMSDELEEKIQAVKEEAVRIKYDYDLD